MENTVETLKSDLETQIEGARKGVRYFESMLAANSAMDQLIRHQIKIAQDILDDFTAEKTKRNNEN